MGVSAVTAIVSSFASDAVMTAVTGMALDIGVTGVVGAWATVATAGAISMGIGAIAGQLIGAPINSALGLGAQPSQVGVNQARGLLINAPSNVDPIPVIYGSRRVGGTMVLCESTGNSNEFLHLIITLCEGPISAINTVYLNDIASTDSRFAGLVTIEKYLGTDTQAASAALIAALGGKWTAAHQGCGVAYLYVKLTANQSAFSSLPTITADIDGRTLYDPRTTTTAFSHNAALAVRDYLTNTRYGRGALLSSINDTSFIAAANSCDTVITTPGGTTPIYTCDGVVNVNQTVYTNIISLLSACNGMLIFSGGQYKLIIDQQTTPSSFIFNEDNITGAWQISKPGRNTAVRAIVNKITANIFNPANNWQPDFAIADNPNYRILYDNNLLLESKIDLPFTADMYRAQLIAQIALKRSRLGTLVQFTAFQSGLKCEVGDVVPITHSTPGWVAKPFRILTIDILSSDEVSILASEYGDSVYIQDSLNPAIAVPSTNLPDPIKIGAPGAPGITESLYQTTGSAGVKSKATMSWSALNNVFVVDYLPEYLAPGASAWTVLSPVRGTSIDIFDLAPGIYQFRFRARNVVGAISAYGGITIKELQGLTASPSAITSFSVIASNGVAIGTWNLSPDLDVRIGGRVYVRWTSLASGAIWENGIDVGNFNGDTVTGLLPMLTGTYLAKTQDSTGHWSDTAISFVLTAGNMISLPNSLNITDSTSFPGVKSGVASVGGVLKLDCIGLIDAQLGLCDIWGYIDSLGGITSSGTYSFSSGMDFGSVVSRRITPAIQALAFDTGDMVDSRGNVDTWSSVDGDKINDATAVLMAAISNDAVSYGSYFPLKAGDVTCRAIKYQLQLATAQPTHNISISQLSVTANW